MWILFRDRDRRGVELSTIGDLISGEEDGGFTSH